MAKGYLIGIDIGTTGTKALLFSEDGALLGQAYRAYPLFTPAVGQSEQAAEDWWGAVVDTVRALCEGKEIGKEVLAISLSTQGGTLVPVDKTGKPLRNAIVWNDGRASAQRAAFQKEVGDARMYEKTGWPLSDGLPALLIRWLKQNEPSVFEETAGFLTVPDYISLKMTGIEAIDPSNAGINQFTNIQTLTYDKDLLHFSGISEEKLPKIKKSGEVIGHLLPEAAEALGLSTDTVLVSGAHDQYAVALGAGATEAGDMLIGSGTCWAVTALSDTLDFTRGLSQSVSAIAGLYGSLWSLSSGGACLDWLRGNVASPHAEGAIDYKTLNEEVEKRQAAAEGLFFFPFSAAGGGKEPFRRATFTGLDLSHDRFHMARAVMEGVCFEIAWMLESFSQKPKEGGIKLTGGATKSRPWVDLISNILGLPVRIPAVADLACVGASILAGVGAGVYESAEEGYRRMAIPETVVYPEKRKSARYAQLFREYKKQALVLRELYGKK